MQYNIHQLSQLMIYSQRGIASSAMSVTSISLIFYFRFSLVKVWSLKRTSTHASEERNRCAIRELKT
jgi:hypothetical protein